MVDGVEEVLSRNAGGRFILDLDIVIRSGSHENAHRISHALETEIKRRFPRVVMVRIRSHPRESDHLRRITPMTRPNGEIKLHLGTAPWFQIEDIDRESGERLDVRFVQNPHADAASRRGYHVGKWLLSMQPDEIVASEDKEGTPILLLKEAGVKIVGQSIGQSKGEAE
jgi:predicted Fe-Mo cluster-binding NifX family protein